MSDVIACPQCGQQNRVRASTSSLPHCGSCKALLPWHVDADERSFQAETTAAVPVLVDLWAQWCGPCLRLAPVLQQLAARNAGKLKVVKVNVDENPALASRFQARSIPLMVLLKDGVEVDRLVGLMPVAQLQARLEVHLPRV